MDERRRLLPRPPRLITINRLENTMFRSATREDYIQEVATDFLLTDNHESMKAVTGAFSCVYGYTRLVRFQAGLYEVQAGTFLWGPMGRVHSVRAIGPVDDFGNIVNLDFEGWDAAGVSLGGDTHGFH